MRKSYKYGVIGSGRSYPYGWIIAANVHPLRFNISLTISLTSYLLGWEFYKRTTGWNLDLYPFPLLNLTISHRFKDKK